MLCTLTRGIFWIWDRVWIQVWARCGSGAGSVRIRYGSGGSGVDPVWNREGSGTGPQQGDFSKEDVCFWRCAIFEVMTLLKSASQTKPLWNRCGPVWGPVFIYVLDNYIHICIFTYICIGESEPGEFGAKNSKPPQESAWGGDLWFFTFCGVPPPSTKECWGSRNKCIITSHFVIFVRTWLPIRRVFAHMSVVVGTPIVYSW